MVVGKWYVQLAALWHRYLPSCINIRFDFCACFYLYIILSLKNNNTLVFNPVSISQRERLTSLAYPSLTCVFSFSFFLFVKGTSEGSKTWVICA